MADNPRPAFMKSLISMCKSLDKEVFDLEMDIKTAVSSSKGQYASNAADLLKAEADLLCRNIKETSAVVTEEKSNLESFMEEMHARFTDIVNETVKIEEYMSQYGYKPRIDKYAILNDNHPVESYAPGAASEFSDVAENSTTEDDENLDEPRGTVTNPAVSSLPRNLSCDSPNFFEIGLSSMTMEAFCGKSKLKVSKPSPEQSNKLLYEGDDSYSASPALKISTKYSDISDKTAVVQSNLVPSINVAGCTSDESYVASPVMRLSSKFTTLPDLSDTSSHNSTSDESMSKDCGGLGLNTDNSSSAQSFVNFNKMQSSSASPCLPSSKLSTRHCVSENVRPNLHLNTMDTGSPEPPELQTIDLRKLVKNSEPVRMTPNMEESLVKEVTPEVPELSYNPKSFSVTKEETPEIPELTCLSFREDAKSPETPVLRSRAFMSLK